MTQFGGAEGSYLGSRRRRRHHRRPGHPRRLRHQQPRLRRRSAPRREIRPRPVVHRSDHRHRAADPALDGQRSAVLHGTVNPDGVKTIACWFEYGLTPSLGTVVPCNEGQELEGSSDIGVTADVGGLKKGTKYWVKVFSANANEVISDGGPEKFLAQSKPIANPVFVSKINTDGANFNATIDPNGGRTWYYWEYGPTDRLRADQTPEKRLRREDATEIELPTSLTEPFDVSDLISGFEPGKPSTSALSPGTNRARRRVRTRNSSPTSRKPNRAARTRWSASRRARRCCSTAAPTSSPRPPTAAATTSSPRRSPGQEPLIAYPDASGRLLYSLDSAVVPGVAGRSHQPRSRPVRRRPRRRRLDAPNTSGSRPAAWPIRAPSARPCSKPTARSTSSRSAGEDICDPCFADGSTNIPLRRSNGTLEKGMAGSSNPAADPAGEVRKRFSADGSTFVFGVRKEIRDDRQRRQRLDLRAATCQSGATQVVSTMPERLDDDRRRHRRARRLRRRRPGPDRRNGSAKTRTATSSSTSTCTSAAARTRSQVVDSPSGVIFNGMTSDGSKVFFTTPDQLAGDTDSSNDLYVADVGATSTITRLSTGTRRHRQHRRLRTDHQLERRLRRAELQRRRDRRRRRSRQRRRDRLLRQPRAARRRRQRHREPGEPLRRQAGRLAAIRRDDRLEPGQARAAPPNHPVANASFAAGLKTNESIAVDQSTGDVYVLERGFPQGVSRFDSEGHPKNFTAGPGCGTNKILVSFVERRGRSAGRRRQLRRDLRRRLSTSTSGGSVKLYAGSGEELGSIGGFGFAVRRRRRPVERRPLRRRLQLRRHLAPRADLGHDSGQRRQLHADQHQHPGHEPLPGRGGHRGQRLRVELVERPDEEVPGLRLHRGRRRAKKASGSHPTRAASTPTRQPMTSTSTKGIRSAATTRRAI